MTSFGIGSFPFLMSILSSVLNIGGNLFSVVVLGWGIKGLAISSVVAAAVVDVCYVVKIWSCFKEMNVHREKVKLGFTYIKKSLPYALPNMAQQLVMYLAGLIVSPLVNGIGASASASYSVISRVYDINAHVYQNSARSVSNYSAQCVGKKEYGKLKKGVRVGLLQGIFFLTPFVVICAVFYKPVCSLFFNAAASAQAKAYAYTFSKVYLPFIFINMLCNLFHGFYRGIKATKYLFVTTLVGAVARVVASLILIPKFGMNGFFIGWVISWVVEAVYSAILFFMGKWYRWEKPKEETLEEVKAE
jgi:Na+-driven multidrug efflux pump